MKNRIIVFEEIGKTSRLAIDWYLLRRFEVRYYRLNGSCKEKPWVRKYIEKGSICPIDPKHNILCSSIGLYPDLAYNNIDRLFAFIAKDNDLLRRLAWLYDDERIHDAVKKVLLGYLQRFYYINFAINKLSDIFSGKEVYFIPSIKKELMRNTVLGFHEYKNLKELLLKSGSFCYEDSGVKFPAWFRLIWKVREMGLFARAQAELAGFIIWVVTTSALNVLRPKRTARQTYKFGVMIISPTRQFTNKIQNIDFLVDGKDIKKEDVLFISWKRLSRQNRNYMKQKGLDLTDDLLNGLNAGSFIRAIPGVLSALAGSLRSGRQLFMLEAAQLLLAYDSIWSSFTDKYNIENLISYCDFGPQSIARNIILSKTGTRTWYYTDAINWTNFFISENKGGNVPFYSSIIGFLHYDYFVTWCDDLISYFKIHAPSIKNHVNVGCLWASHIKDVEGGRIGSDLLSMLREHGFKDGHKLVSVFDSTYADYTITPYGDGIDFLKGIYRLLEEVPGIFMIYKEKHTRAYIKERSEEMLFWLEKLESHPRCCLPLKHTNTSETIAFSDLTISFPFTSTTFEALSARRRALYYDVSGKFRGTFYDQAPGLVCHDHKELLCRTKELLYGTSDEEYSAYLDRFVKGKIEPYLDGAALARFRKLLTER